MQVSQILHCSFVIDQPHQSLFANHKNYLCFKLIRDAIFFSSPQLAKKRRQIRLLDYWQFKVLHSALICFTNPASPNFFTGRAGFVLRTHTAHLPKSAKKSYDFSVSQLLDQGYAYRRLLFKEYSVILHILWLQKIIHYYE